MRLLLVEDDSMIGEGLRQGLRGAGYTVDWVRDGRVAEAAVRSTPYDLLLLDLGLPGKDGLPLLRSLHARDADLATIIITARDGLAERLSGLDAGADDYLVKPFALAELAARIRAVSRRRSGRTHPELRAGPLRMDPSRHLVWLPSRHSRVISNPFIENSPRARWPTSEVAFYFNRGLSAYLSCLNYLPPLVRFRTFQ